MSDIAEFDRPTNYLTRVQYRDACVRVCQAVYDILCNHCGPVARYAAWPSTNTIGETTDTEFSKDGISIVERLHYPEDSIERQILDTIIYVGKRVNNACFDGSTTAIMAVTGLIETYFAVTDKKPLVYPYKNDNQHPHQIHHSLEMMFAIMERALDVSKVTVDTYETEFGMSTVEARQRVAYAQAMISSKGDRELSTALAELVSKTPVEKLFGQYALDHHVHEAATRVEAKTYPAQIGFRATMCEPALNNKNLGTEYETASVNLIVTENTVIAPSPFFEFLKTQLDLWSKFLQQSALALAGAQEPPSPEGLNPILSVSHQDLVLISPEFSSNIKSATQVFNRHCKRAGWAGRLILIELLAQNTVSTPYYITAVRALAGGHPNPDECLPNIAASVITGASVHHRAGFLYLGNLYESADDDIFVPQYLQAPEARNELYHGLITDIEFLIRRQLDSHDSEKIADAYFKDFLQIFRHLICRNWISLKLGGTTHELRSLISVADDTFGAVEAAMEHGFIFGGIWRMMAMVDVAIYCTENQQPLPALFGSFTIDYATDLSVLRCLRDTLSDVLQVSYALSTVDGGKNDSTTTDLLHPIRTEAKPPEETQMQATEFAVTIQRLSDPFYHHFYLRHPAADMVMVIDRASLNPRSEEVTGLLQPIRGHYELIKRLREILPGIFSTATYLLRKKK